MVDEHKIVRDLRQASAKYLDSAKGDILNALRFYKELKSDVDKNFQYPDMKRRPAFKLAGTIPISYRGSTYNIPVTIYLWDTHPYYAPICFVNPTPTMLIKESENVNKQGRVFLPYLNEWRFPGYDLYGLIQMMVMVFQERPPLFSKPAGQQTAPNSSSAAMSQPSFAHPAMPTAYPTENTAPYPVHNHGPTPTPYPGGGPTPYPVGFGAGYPVAQPNRPAPPIPPPPATSTNDAIRLSLISAIEEKMKNRLRDKIGKTYAEMASMRQTQSELKAGQQKIKAAIDGLEAQRRDLDQLLPPYNAKKRELEEALRQRGGDGSEGPSLDDVIDVTSPLHRQLLNAFAADQACEESYYVLGQALKRGSLTVSDYLKHVRDISRRQFVQRATMRKCRVAAGLPV